jgi:IclR family transcriptional regulator, mhp operon transcriptional activator
MEKGVPIRALGRGIAVLQAINRGGPLTMMEIAHASEVPYPTACRIVQTLLYEGLIEREPNRKRYRPTALVQTLAHGFQGHGRLVQVVRPHIVELTRKIGWPITLTTHVGSSMVIRDSTHAQTSLTFNNYYPGYALPILECAAGLVYLAFADPAERDSILHGLRLMPNQSAAHVLDAFQHGRLAADIRRAGYAARNNNQFTQNPGKTSSIAVPVFEHEHVAGTLTLAFFSSATDIDDVVKKFLAPLQATAETIARELNGAKLQPAS